MIRRPLQLRRQTPIPQEHVFRCSCCLMYPLRPELRHTTFHIVRCDEGRPPSRIDVICTCPFQTKGRLASRNHRRNRRRSLHAAADHTLPSIRVTVPILFPVLPESRGQSESPQVALCMNPDNLEFGTRKSWLVDLSPGAFIPVDRSSLDA
ncbi:hypothetical protein M433DRAFT_300116 [Acidomyces richmondensis BFW]|nr:MAG: hypothetical protein FE78DRAFT_510621 [Acidomyces sp. 'richmondensis']KYG44534.1 hypothetical protein M433DRAFT_300116 [Acidomyces richmondensis BFW]